MLTSRLKIISRVFSNMTPIYHVISAITAETTTATETDVESMTAKAMAKAADAENMTVQAMAGAVDAESMTEAMTAEAADAESMTVQAMAEVKVINAAADVQPDVIKICKTV